MANFTRQAIKESFLKLLDERPLSKISVKDIVEDCGINRNSFYYHFQDIPALLSETISEQADEVIQKHPSVQSLEECFEAAFCLATEKQQTIKHIYQSVNRGAFTDELMKLCESVVRKYIESAYGQSKMNEADLEIVIRFLKCQLYGMIIDWISAGMKEDAMEDLSRMIQLCKGVPELLLEHSLKK